MVVYSPTSTAAQEIARPMGQQHRDRRLAAVAIRADGRRVPVQLPDAAEVSILAKLELVALGLLAILTGSRREPGGQAEVAEPAKAATHRDRPGPSPGGEGLSFVRPTSTPPTTTTEPGTTGRPQKG